MDNELRLIRYLYGEEKRPKEVEQLLAADSALRAEYRKLKATKDYLDTRPRQQPDAAVVDCIVAAAANHQPEPARQVAEPRGDREPVARTRMPWHRILGLTTAVAVLLVAVSIGLWQWDGFFADPSASEAVVDAQSATEQSEAPARGTTAREDAAIPAWDEADDVVRLHHYIETLQARSSPNSWDSPEATLQPASQVRPSTNR